MFTPYKQQKMCSSIQSPNHELKSCVCINFFPNSINNRCSMPYFRIKMHFMLTVCVRTCGTVALGWIWSVFPFLSGTLPSTGCWSSGAEKVCETEGFTTQMSYHQQKPTQMNNSFISNVQHIQREKNNNPSLHTHPSQHLYNNQESLCCYLSY